MFLYAVAFIVSLVLFNDADCRYARNYLIRRQNQPMYPNPTVYPLNPFSEQNSFPALNSGFTPANGNSPLPYGNQPRSSNFPPAIVGLPPVFSGFPNANQAAPVGNAGIAPGNSGFPSENAAAPVNPVTPPLPAPLPPPMPSYPVPNFNPNKGNLKRRRKNAAKNGHELEKIGNGKQFLKRSAVSDILNKTSFLKDVDDYLVKDLENSNATLIPIHNGVQIKALSKQDDEEINSIINITSSTQRILSFDNTTEIENMVEMQMQKKIEDDKGANRGSEEVRIVETERVKPLINKRVLNRRRKSYNKRFAVYHRSKRSLMDSTETPSNSVFNKMARRFLSVVKRKERVVDRNTFSNRQKTSNFRESSQRNTASTVKQTREESIYDKNEIDDFVKFFLKQMQKFRKSREDIKNNTIPFKSLHTSEWWDKAKISPRKLKKLKKHVDYPERMNVFMNLNMTWDTKLNQNTFKSRSYTGNRSHSALGLEKTTTPSTLTTQQRTITLVYIDERSNYGFFNVALLFSAVTFLFTLTMWIIRGKLFKVAKPNKGRSSKARTYRFYHDGKCEEMKCLKCAAIENVCMEDYPQLEWQSENGDWLSEKEMDFK